MKNNGKLIVFEGLDFSGKSTQIKLLSKYLCKKNIDHIQTREPGGTTLSENLRKIILHTEIDPITEIMLYEASRREHIVQKILPALNSGKLVISDRFYDSSTAYQGYGRELSIKTIETLNDIVTETNIIPILTFFIDIPIETLKSRLKLRKKLDKFEKNLDEKFFKRVRNGFLEIAKNRKDYRVIDGTQTIEQIHSTVIEIIKDIV